MELCRVLVALLMIWQVAGLECWTCTEMDSPEDCAKHGKLATCTGNNDVCQTIVRRVDKNVFVVKGCKEDVTCKRNENQNSAQDEYSSACNDDQPNSRCTCCCHGDACNTATQTCIRTQGCPAIPTTPHVSLSCSDDHRAGSVCKVTCDEEPYQVYPADFDTTTCLKTGSWSRPLPCCAKPCPPYFVYDSVLLYHTSNNESFRTVMYLIAQSARRVAIGLDSALFAGFYYSGSPLLSSQHFFNEYQGDVAVLTGLLTTRLVPMNTEDGLVNTGAAIQHALNHFYSIQAGARGLEVPKALTVITDSNSNDDVKEPAKRARELGYSTNVIALTSRSKQLVMEEFRDITGDDDRLFMIDVENPDIEGYFKQAEKQFCKPPC